MENENDYEVNFILWHDCYCNWPKDQCDEIFWNINEDYRKNEANGSLCGNCLVDNRNTKSPPNMDEKMMGRICCGVIPDYYFLLRTSRHVSIRGRYLSLVWLIRAEVGWVLANAIKRWNLKQSRGIDEINSWTSSNSNLIELKSQDSQTSINFPTFMKFQQKNHLKENFLPTFVANPSSFVLLLYKHLLRRATSNV